MKIRHLDAADAPAAQGAYAQVCEVSGARRLAFISGQVPASTSGVMPRDFAGQARQVWANVEAQLRAVDMTLDNLVKVTTYLADRRYALDNRTIRTEILAGRKPALTVVIAGIFDEGWLLEIEAVAAA